MAPQKRRGRFLILLKSLVLVITCLSFLGILSCNTGTNSTTSSDSGGGIGVGWTITIQIGTNPIRLGNTTSVLAIVKDNTGAPAPKGTNVCMTAVQNGFLTPGSPIDPEKLVKNICETTTNDLGQSIQTYYAPTTGNDTVEVSSQGIITTKIITVTN